MTSAEFKRKWARFSGKESAAYQEHFGDLCRLLGQQTPAEADPTGTESFCFQKRVIKDAELFELLETVSGESIWDQFEDSQRTWKRRPFHCYSNRLLDGRAKRDGSDIISHVFPIRRPITQDGQFDF